jgi:hypothetical protein
MFFPDLIGRSVFSRKSAEPVKIDRGKTSNSRYTVSMRGSDLRIGPFRPRSIVLEKAAWVRGLVCLAVVTSIPFAAAFPQSQVGNGLPYPPPQPGVAPMNRMANPTADANRLMVDSMKLQNSLKAFELLNVQRQKEMTSDTAKLVELANQLKTDADRGVPDAISILEIRRAELIERLAHNIQHKMRATPSQ